MFSLFLLFIVLLCSSAFFSGSETALFSLSNVQLHRLKKTSGGAAARVVAALREPRKMLVTILLGNELVNVSMSIVGAAIVARVFHASVEGQTIIAVAIITPIILVAGEILPKNLALRFAPQIAPVAVWPLAFFYKIARPFRAVLTGIADRVIMMMGGAPERIEPMIMEDEFKRLVDLGRREGVIATEERELIHNVFEFTDKVVADIMKPAERIFSLPVDMPYERMIAEIKNVQFSRVPFYDGARDDVTGILHVRDLFAFHRKRQAGEDVDIRGLLGPPLFIRGSVPLEQLLKEFQRTQLHMALVRDQDENLIGIVTMDDVLEELFGEME